jgi:hypothetical protein
MTVLCEPRLAGFVEVVARPVVDDEENLTTAISSNQLLEKAEKGCSAEYFREPI